MINKLQRFLPLYWGLEYGLTFLLFILFTFAFFLQFATHASSKRQCCWNLTLGNYRRNLCRQPTLQPTVKSVVFTNKVGKNSRYFVGVFNNTIIPLVLVGYEMIIANLALRVPGVQQMQTADWQVNEVNIVVKCFNRFSIPKL